MNILFLEGDMSRTGGTERMTAWLSTELSEKYNIQMQITLRFMPDCQKIDYLCTININK